MTRTPDDFARLYDGGLSIREVAARTGTSYRFARAQLIEAGVEFRTPTPMESTLALADDCAALYRQGLSIRAVGARVGYSDRYARDLIVLGGAELRDYPRRPRKGAAA
ncbi:helix-turn-helix domain-containing protein [Streptomyces althioticus]|uniref:helix-turn-helix domain-containing protein n=1 Tax=Streptomyces althioticus TaxID=83380 RepID=UPI00379218F2